MKLKVPPVIIVGVIAGFMWFLARYNPLTDYIFHAPRWFRIVPVVLGGILGVLGVIQFHNNKTTINPHQPENSTKLVISGVYRISRNPMYLALLLILIAYGVHLGQIVPFMALPLFIWYMNEFQIKPEEQVLLEKFGNEYEKFRKRVRRWI